MVKVPFLLFGSNFRFTESIDLEITNLISSTKSSLTLMLGLPDLTASGL